MRVAEFLRQSDVKWLDVRHVLSLCWMMIGIIHSERVHLSAWGVYTRFPSRLCPVASATVSPLAIESPHQSGWRLPGIAAASAVRLGRAATVSEFGYDPGVESLLHSVVRRGIPTDGRFPLPGG